LCFRVEVSPEGVTEQQSPTPTPLRIGLTLNRQIWRRSDGRSVLSWRATFEPVTWSTGGLATLARNIERSEFAFLQNVTDIVTFAFDKTFAAYPALIRDIFKYLSKLSDHGPKPNREAQLSGRFAKAHALVQTAIRKARIPAKKARISCASPSGGIQDNTVNGLLLMSSSEKHLAGVPMAFFIEERLAD
jgi:hypothetical protein